MICATHVEKTLMFKLPFRFALCLLPLFLSACGDGWELVKTDKYAPYGNSRTAGSGVAYVRAKMLPEHDVKLEPAQKVEGKTDTKHGKAIEELQKMFSDHQKK